MPPSDAAEKLKLHELPNRENTAGRRRQIQHRIAPGSKVNIHGADDIFLKSDF